MQRNRGKQQNWNNRVDKTWPTGEGNISCKDGHNKGQKCYGLNKQKILRRGGKNTQKNYTKKVLTQ